MNGSDADYRDDALVETESRHFWFRARARLIVWTVGRYFPRATSMLEIGCGTGYVLASLRDAFPHLRLTGSEIRAEGLERARRRLQGVELLQLDARRLPFRDEFDLIGAFDVLEHIDADEVVLAEMAQAVRPGGGIVLTVPQHRWLWSRVDDFSHHRRRYTRQELISKLERAGFVVRRATSFMTALLPALALARAVDRRSRAPFDPTAELRVPAAANVAAEWLLDAERAAIRAGISWPAGGSLLVAAERRY